MKKYALVFLLIPILLSACKNRAINEGEEFRPKEIHEKIDYHFDNITVDGVEYLILSRDNNNPHEGFGFMAFRANELLKKQDSILAYLKVLGRMQTEIHSRMLNVPIDQSQYLLDSLYKSALGENTNLTDIEKATYSSSPR